MAFSTSPSVYPTSACGMVPMPALAPKNGAVMSCEEPMKPFTLGSARLAAALPTAAP
jgi:hypothetical protein